MGTSPAEFVRQVKQESAKVTWPTKKETWMAAITILIVVTILSLFFFATDYVASSSVKALLGLK